MIYLNDKRVKIETFPNGESKILLDSLDIHDLEVNPPYRGHNEITLRYENDADLVHLFFLKRHVENAVPVSWTIGLTLHYVPYSRMDRQGPNEVFTLKYLTDLINSMRFSRVRIAEPHSDVTTALLDRVHVLTSYSTMHLLEKAMIETGFDPGTDVIVFPDAGAQKRYSAEGFEHTVVGNKHRDWATGRIDSLDLIGATPADGRKAIIVDDLTSYGGTFLMTAHALREYGYREIYLVVTHAEKTCLQGDLLKEDSPITKLFTTDSILHPGDIVWDKSPYREKVHFLKEMTLLS